MEQLKRELLTIMRDGEIDIATFRNTSRKLNEVLVHEVATLLPTRERKITTPVTESHGPQRACSMMLIPILRSGLPMLHSFVEYFDDARIGVLGFVRDEHTFASSCYYNRIPEPKKDDIVVIMDPMIATGGTACGAINIVKDMGTDESRIIFAAMLASPEGYNHVREQHPDVRIVIAQIDERLNDVGYIVPGLGDFGDRYFGTL